MPEVCACSLARPERYSRAGSPSGRQLTGVTSHHGISNQEMGAGLGWSRARPRIVLAKSTVNVHSMAQVLKNLEVGLSVLKDPDMTGLPKSILYPNPKSRSGNCAVLMQQDVLDCQPYDILHGRVSLWQILHRIYLADKSNSAIVKHKSLRSRSTSPPAARLRRSCSPPRVLREQKNALRRSRPKSSDPIKASPPQVPHDQSKEPEARGDKVVHEKQQHIEKSKNNRETTLTQSETQTDNKIQIPAKAENRRHSYLLSSTTSGFKQRRNSIRKEKESFRQPAWDDTCTPSSRKNTDTKALHLQLEWRKNIGKEIWGRGQVLSKAVVRSSSVSPTRTKLSENPLLKKLSPKTIDPQFATGNEVIRQYTQNKKQMESKKDLCAELTTSQRELDAEIALRDSFPPVTNQQQESIRRWIIDLGIEFRDGDGGFLSK